MRRSLIALAMIAGALAGVSVAHAYMCNSTGCNWESDYTEPSTLTNGQPLTDLSGCTLSYTTAVDNAAPGPAKTVTVVASKPGGGGAMVKTNTDAAMVPGHTYTIAETVSCTSTAFGTSAPSPAASLTMNNGVTVNPTAAPVLK